MLKKISDDNFDENVKNASTPFVLVFSSPWCGTCKNVMLRMESLSEKFDAVQFGKIDITTSNKKPSEFEVLSIPSIIIFKDGEERDRIAGDVSEKELKEKIEKLL